MADDPKPYVPHNPGDLITAEDWNDMQVDVRKDMAAQIATSIAGVKDVDHASNADKIGGQSVSDLTKAILDQVFALLPKRTGYMQVFCNLELNTDKIIQHNLKTYPITDVYQLDYFQVVCAKSSSAADSAAEWVQFYLYHGDEQRLRLPPSTVPIEIETKPKYRILWKTLIDQLAEQKLLTYTDDTTLDDLDTDFWRAMFHDPNDEFDPDAYCHSPWFEKCCGEKRSVGDLKKHGDFDDIYLKVMPRKTINFPIARMDGATNLVFGNPADGVDAGAAPEPTNIRVSHLDFDSVAVRLLKAPVFPTPFPAGTAGAPPILPLPGSYTKRLSVMVLLKV
jgi:hypothetical protein